MLCESLEDRRMLATFTVTDAADAGLGTLRQAIQDANTMAGADRIEFDSALDGVTISLTSAGLTISEDVVIDATNLSALTVDAKPLDLTPGSADGRGARVFDITSGDAEFHGLTIRGGDILGDGAGIRTAGSLTVSDSHFIGNRAFASGSAISVIVPYGGSNRNVSITNSTFTNNGNLKWNFGSGAVGGAIHVNFPDNGTGNMFTLQDSVLTGNGHGFATGPTLAGGALYLVGGGQFTIDGSTVSNNQAFNDSGGGAFIVPYSGTVNITNTEIDNNQTTTGNAGGIYFYIYDSTVTVTDSIISGNDADGEGGGVFARTYGNAMLTFNDSAIINNATSAAYPFGNAGGLYLNSSGYSDITMANSTVSGNQAQALGGGVRAIVDDYSTLHLSNSTVANNTAALNGVLILRGAGLSASAPVANPVTIENTMLADNMLYSGSDDDLAGVLDANFSLIEAFDMAAVTLTGADNITGTDPMLGPLADNGGGTMTHEVPQGSAAIDAGNPMTTGTFDQRGMPFTRVIDGSGDMNAVVDVGAFERQFGPNTAPLADAGAGFMMAFGRTMALDGTGTNDPDAGPLPLTYSWEIIAGPSTGGLQMVNSPTPMFTPDALGDYTIQLTVDDGDLTDTDTVLVQVVQNGIPVADSSLSDTHVAINFPIVLDGTASSDPDMDVLSFQWTVIEQPPASNPMISVPTASSTSMFTSTPGRYVVELVVNDGLDFSVPDTVEILVFDPGGNTAPVAVTGTNDVTIFVGETAMLTGSDSYDVDLDTLTYDWTITASPPGGDGVLTNPTGANTDFNATVSGDYEVEFVVNDGMVDSQTEVVTIHLLDNNQPVADVSLSQSSGIETLPITLDGSRSSDLDSQPLTYTWSVIAQPMGSNPVIDAPTDAVTFWTTDMEGIYRIRLVVNDGLLDSAPKVFLVNVADGEAPTANVSQSASGGQVNAPITLDGSLSSDLQMDPLTYVWSIVVQPMGSNPVIADPTAVTTTWSTDTEGMYRLRLVVNDGTLDSDPVEFSVVVTAAGIPTADVSLSQNAGIVSQPITLNATRSSDPGMAPLTYQWSIINQPTGSNPVIADPTAAATTWTTDVAGAYRVRLIVNNGTLDSLPVTFLTNVSAMRPILNVGLPANSGPLDLNVTGSGSLPSDLNNLRLMQRIGLLENPTRRRVSIVDRPLAVTSLPADTAAEYRNRPSVRGGTPESDAATRLVATRDTRVRADAQLPTSLEARDRFFAEF